MNLNDSTSTTLIPFKIFGTENYRIWASDMKLALQARNKFAFVDGSCVKTAFVTSDVLSAKWDRLNSLWREFDSLTKLPTCTCDANKEFSFHNKLMKLMQFIMELDDCYQSVRSSLITRDPLPEVKDAYTIVFKKESHRGILESSNVSESKLNATSFAAKSFNVNKRSNNDSNSRRSTNFNNNRGPNPNLACKNYGMIGYAIERCYELIGYPPGFERQHSFSSTSAHASFTSIQMRKMLNLINETPIASMHANVTVKTITMGWIIDSGASQLLTVYTVGMFDVIDISSLKSLLCSHPKGTLATI
ncbi:ribonuclease H-like domain-containing protein [Tanacetum coccineum]